MNACGCRVPLPFVDEARIVYCPLHERADRLAAALANVLGAYSQAAGVPLDHDNAIHHQTLFDMTRAEARALLREIGQ